jgi:hypothetical protein
MRNLILAFMVFCSGCATVDDKYRGMYDDAILNDTSAEVVVDAYLTTLTEVVDAHLAALGYTKVLHEAPTQRLVVMTKKKSADEKIMVKYTRTEEGKMRVDLVNASTNPVFRDVVQKDIEQLVALINED